MLWWVIYYEDERTGNRTLLGMLAATTMAEALQRAGEYFEKDGGDLVAIRKK